MTTSSPTTIIYWFRNDLRLDDQPALTQACQQATQLLFVYCHSPSLSNKTRWNVPRTSRHRQEFLTSTLADLSNQIKRQGSHLLEVKGNPVEILQLIARDAGALHLYCEEIAAPEEQDQVSALRASGLKVNTVWQSSLLNPYDLPYAIDALPNVFSHFRQTVENKQIQPPSPLPRPENIPPLPKTYAAIAKK